MAQQNRGVGGGFGDHAERVIESIKGREKQKMQ
jgi:hypothetical protein